MLRTSALLLVLCAAANAQVVIKPNYCFGMLMTAPNRATLPNEEAQRIQSAHIGHLNALAEKRWLVAAGPIVTPGNLRGLAISKCKSVEEAIEFGNQDPAVKHGRLTVEAYGWQADEGIGARYWEEKSKDPAYKEKMVKHPLAMLVKTAEWKGMPSMEVLRPHFQHVMSLLKDGRLKTAGPFAGESNKMGVFIFAPMPLEEAKALAEADPTVKAGLVRVEMLEWLTVDGTFPK
ncbi:MAG: hypothetical protein JNL98_19225 [Bryobacterales bacterium]|nr:hypothetical protein [Bryobacterales bacterium]